MGDWIVYEFAALILISGGMLLLGLRTAPRNRVSLQERRLNEALHAFGARREKLLPPTWAARVPRLLPWLLLLVGAVCVYLGCVARQSEELAARTRALGQAPGSTASTTWQPMSSTSGVR